MNNDLFDLDIQIQKGDGSVTPNNSHYYGGTCTLDTIGCYTITCNCGGVPNLPNTMYSCNSNCDFTQ